MNRNRHLRMLLAGCALAVAALPAQGGEGRAWRPAMAGVPALPMAPPPAPDPRFRPVPPQAVWQGGPMGPAVGRPFVSVPAMQAPVAPEVPAFARQYAWRPVAPPLVVPVHAPPPPPPMLPPATWVPHGALPPPPPRYPLAPPMPLPPPLPAPVVAYPGGYPGAFGFAPVAWGVAPPPWGGPLAAWGGAPWGIAPMPHPYPMPYGGWRPGDARAPGGGRFRRDPFRPVWRESGLPLAGVPWMSGGCFWCGS